MATLSAQIAKALRAKDVGPVRADPWTTAPSRRVSAVLDQPLPDLLADLGYPQAQDLLRQAPAPVQTATNLLLPSAADVAGGLGRRAVRAAVLGGQTLSRMAAKAPEELRHAIGLGRLLSRPVSEMQFKRELLPRKELSPTRVLTPAALEGSALIPLSGDRSIGGQMVTRIGDVPVEVPTFGGPIYMRTHSPYGAAWASTETAAEKLAKRVQTAGEKSPSGKVFGVYMPQGHESLHFASFMTDATMQQVRARPPHKVDVKQFDAVVRKKFPDWVGLLHPTAEDQLLAPKMGNLRHYVMKQMDQAKWQKQGFPDLAQTRAALTESALLDTPAYHGGFAVAELDPTRLTVQGRGPRHPTYETQLPGRYAGQLPQAVPMQVLFPQFAKARAAKAAEAATQGKKISRSADYQAIKYGLPIQSVTPQMLRGLERFLAK